VGVDGKITLKWMLRKWDGKVWTGGSLVSGDQWWAFMNAVMNLGVLCHFGNFLSR
jgi:hypothetical protein